MRTDSDARAYVERSSSSSGIFVNVITLPAGMRSTVSVRPAVGWRAMLVACGSSAWWGCVYLGHAQG